MKSKLRKGILILLVMAFCCSCGIYAYELNQQQVGEEDYALAAELVQLPQLPVPSETSAALSEKAAATPLAASVRPESSEELPEPEPTPTYIDPYADALRNMDFTALQEVNDDILGWILIPGTNISYPLVQGEDNDYYLNHTWRKNRSSVGAIFLERQNNSDLSDFNTMIYGHRMNNKSMFGTLHNYKDPAYWSTHPNLYLTDSSGTASYEIFAAYEVSVTGWTYQLGFADEAEKQFFIDYCLEQSVIDTGIVPTVYDKVVTLSTCTGNGHATRWVVQAVLRGQTPPDTAES